MWGPVSGRLCSAIYALNDSHLEVDGHEAPRSTQKGVGIAWSLDPTPSVSPSRRSVATALPRVPLLAAWPFGQPVTGCAAMA
jgi:hypothetical protein